jgi:flagellar assembly factor FliW
MLDKLYRITKNLKGSIILNNLPRALRKQLMLAEQHYTRTSKKRAVSGSNNTKDEE